MGHFFLHESRPERRGDFDVSEPAQYSAPRTGSPFVFERQKTARRRTLHLISHLHRKHQMVNTLAISPGGGALASRLNPTCPLALPAESPADVREISLSAGFKSPKSLHMLWNKTSAHCGPSVAWRALRRCRCPEALDPPTLASFIYHS